MIEAIWPSFTNWDLSSLPPSASITAPALLSFVIFWLASLPLLYLSIPLLRWIFLIKIALMPFFGVVLFTWALTAADGWPPLFSMPNKIIDGWTLGYAFVYTINISISGSASQFIHRC